MYFQYATKYGVQTDTLRGVAQASRCIPEVIRQILLMLVNDLEILFQQDLVIIYFVRLIVTSVLSFNSRVFLAEATTNITK